jgi:hypothetical protein
MPRIGEILVNELVLTVSSKNVPSFLVQVQIVVRKFDQYGVPQCELLLHASQRLVIKRPIDWANRAIALYLKNRPEGVSTPIQITHVCCDYPEYASEVTYGKY